MCTETLTNIICLIKCKHNALISYISMEIVKRCTFNGENTLFGKQNTIKIFASLHINREFYCIRYTITMNGK